MNMVVIYILLLAKTNNGKTFTYTFSENRTLKEIRYTLEEIAKQLDT